MFVLCLFSWVLGRSISYAEHRYSILFHMAAMLLSGLVAATCVLNAAASFTPASTIGTDRLAAQGLFNLAKCELEHYPPPQCNTRTACRRREWSTLSHKEKRDYINAVLCLQSKPSLSTSDYYPAPGARSRYDDFVATHINQTLTIHGTVC